MSAMRAGKRLLFPSIRLKAKSSLSWKTAPSAAAPMSYKSRSIATAACGLGRKGSELLALIFCVIVPVAVGAQSPPRYQALLQNGQRIQGKTLTDWHEPQRIPRIDSQALLDLGNSARWLRDRTQPLADAPGACLEMHSGDCFPANVLEARSGLDAKADPLPAHLIAEPRVTLEPPKDRPLPRVRIDASYVRRIVWQRRRKLD